MISDGTTFGPYRLGEELGRGGMGQVFRAHHLDLKRDVETLSRR